MEIKSKLKNYILCQIGKVKRRGVSVGGTISAQQQKVKAGSGLRKVAIPAILEKYYSHHNNVDSETRYISPNRQSLVEPYSLSAQQQKFKAGSRLRKLAIPAIDTPLHCNMQ